jgi:hypothetical protein
LKRLFLVFGLLMVVGLGGWILLPPRDHKPPIDGASLNEEAAGDGRLTSTPLLAGPPRLAVLLIFDQLRGDYPERWGMLFGPGGFRRFTEEGSWFRECHYPYASTYTGPGHATLATGASPNRHGIVGNDWYDRHDRTSVYCATTPGYERVSETPPKTQAKSGVGGSPLRLKSPTLADAFRNRHPGCHVVSLSMKDRGAILPAGGSTQDGTRAPAPPLRTACFWFDTHEGLFVTSTFYDGPRPWVNAFNRDRKRFIERFRGKVWDRLATVDYDYYVGPDDVEGESSPFGSRTFPHRLDDGKRATGKGYSYYDTLYTSPMGNDVLLDLTLAAIEGEALGTRDVPDLLCVSFSCNDTVGHAWGPDSHEVLDCTLRTDRLLRRLFEGLDARVGKGRYVVVLSADHGVCPLPAVARARGWEARYVAEKELTQAAEDFLQAAFPGSPAGTALEPVGDKGEFMRNDSFYLRPEWLKARMVPQERVEELLAGWARTRQPIASAYTRSQLLNGPPPDLLGVQVQRSFHPERSGDVMLVLKPYHFTWDGITGTTHGSPYPYDTHVPLMVYGPSIPHRNHWVRVSPEAAAVILCRAFDVPPPDHAAVDNPLQAPRDPASLSRAGYEH